MAIHLDISSKFSNQGKYLFRYLGQWHENLVLVIWNNWVVTFRENHIVWLRIQDTRISYLLIARNPRLKTQTVQSGIVLLVFLLLGVTRGLKDDIMSISITSAFNWVLSLLLTHNPHCHLHRHPHRHDHDDYHEITWYFERRVPSLAISAGLSLPSSWCKGGQFSSQAWKSNVYFRKSKQNWGSGEEIIIA